MDSCCRSISSSNLGGFFASEFQGGLRWFNPLPPFILDWTILGIQWDNMGIDIPLKIHRCAPLPFRRGHITLQKGSGGRLQNGKAWV